MSKTFYGVASITNSNRSKIQIVSCSPGPGSYDPKLIQSSPKCALKQKLTHGCCFQQKENNPAPGTYDLKLIEKSFCKKNNKPYTGDKYKNYVDKCPLSQLNIPSAFNCKAGFSFGYRDSVILKQSSPGPIYDTNQIIQRKRTSKKKDNCTGFGLGNRNAIYRNNSVAPGPTAYYSKDNFFNTSSCWSFSKEQRAFQKQLQSSLGPGQYNPQFYNLSKSCKFKQKLPPSQPQTYKNGPGSYNPPNLDTNIGTKFSQEKSRSLQLLKNDSPSPFSYEKKRFPENISGSTGFTLASSLKSTSATKGQIPSPGTYQISKDISKNKQGGYIGRKPQSKIKQMTQDNFYKYTPNIDAVSKGGYQYSFAQQQINRNTNADRNELGPGAYDVKEDAIENYSFGKQKRWPQTTKEPFLNKFNNTNCYAIGYMPSYLIKKQSKK